MVKKWGEQSRDALSFLFCLLLLPLSRDGEDLKELQNLGFRIQSIESMQLRLSLSSSELARRFVCLLTEGAGGSVDRTESHPPSLLAALLLARHHFPGNSRREKKKRKIINS